MGKEIEYGGTKTGFRVGRELGRMFGNKDRDRRWWEEDWRVGREVGRMFGNRDRDRRWWEEDRNESWEGGRKDVRE